jgi:hypothetical protein
MAWNEPGKIVLGIEAFGKTVPSAQIGSGSRQPCLLPEGLQQTVFAKIQEQLMVLIELNTKGSIKKLDLGVAKDRQWGLALCRCFPSSPGRHGAGRNQARRRNACRLKKLPSGFAFHH